MKCAGLDVVRYDADRCTINSERTSFGSKFKRTALHSIWHYYNNSVLLLQS